MGKEFIKRRVELVSQYGDMFKEFVAALVAKVPDSTVILVGSRARGDAKPSSDFDIVLVTVIPPS
ncbi:MAG: nucleotidyltransferase domain-containing protein [Pyrobaculum sp.]